VLQYSIVRGCSCSCSCGCYCAWGEALVGLLSLPFASWACVYMVHLASVSSTLLSFSSPTGRTTQQTNKPPARLPSTSPLNISHLPFVGPYCPPQPPKAAIQEPPPLALQAPKPRRRCARNWNPRCADRAAEPWMRFRLAEQEIARAHWVLGGCGGPVACRLLGWSSLRCGWFGVCGLVSQCTCGGGDNVTVLM
jgi:hypothetical protein